MIHNPVVKSARDLGAMLAIRRYELYLTQIQVAELASISLRSLKQMEAGQGNPGIQPLLRLLDVLGLQISIDKRTTYGDKIR